MAASAVWITAIESACTSRTGATAAFAAFPVVSRWTAGAAITFRKFFVERQPVAPTAIIPIIAIAETTLYTLILYMDGGCCVFADPGPGDPAPSLRFPRMAEPAGIPRRLADLGDGFPADLHH